MRYCLQHLRCWHIPDTGRLKVSVSQNAVESTAAADFAELKTSNDDYDDDQTVDPNEFAKLVKNLSNSLNSSSLHHSAMEQYSNLSKDLKSKLLIGLDDVDSAENLLNEYKEKVKFIKSYEPSFSRCVSYNK